MLRPERSTEHSTHLDTQSHFRHQSMNNSLENVNDNFHGIPGTTTINSPVHSVTHYDGILPKPSPQKNPHHLSVNRTAVNFFRSVHNTSTSGANLTTHHSVSRDLHRGHVGGWNGGTASVVEEVQQRKTEGEASGLTYLKVQNKVSILLMIGD